MIVPPYKLIEFSDYDDELFDLERDPREATNLAELRPEVVALLQSALPPLRIESSPVSLPDLSSETTERLRELGYLGED